jgi:hypothetical protein
VIEVARMHRPCIACPSLWQGVTIEGKLFYASFHQGVLEAGIASNDPTPHQLRCKQPIYQQKIGDKKDGYLSDDDLQKHLQHLVRLPKTHIGGLIT